jgi:O-antigen/teichoic acid export membrane protein
MGTSLLVLPVVLVALSPAELGVWYGLLALVGIATLVDFGFGPSFSRFAAYLHAGAAELSPEGLAAGSLGSPNWTALADLRATASRLYGAIAAVAAVLIVVSGVLTVVPEVRRLPSPSTVLAGVAVTIFAATFSVAESRHGNILSGLGGITEAVRAGIAGSAAQVLVSLTLVSAGAGILGLALGYASGIVTTAALCRLVLRRRFRNVPRGRTSAALLRAMWPNVWRLGIVMIGSYLITQGNTLVSTRVLGAAETATYGLSLQVVQFAASTCFVFLSTKTPLFARLRQEGAADALKQVWIVGMRRSVAAYALAAVTACAAGPYLLALMHSRTRLLPVSQLVALFVIRFLEAHHSAYGSLIVTENRVPFVVPAIVSGLAILGLTIALAPTWGLWAIIAVPGVVQACWNNWWAVARGLRGIDLSARAYLRGLIGARSVQGEL